MFPMARFAFESDFVDLGVLEVRQVLHFWQVKVNCWMVQSLEF